MTDVGLNHRQSNFDDFSPIHLDDEDERCGEIFITLSRNIIFHCTICASNFGSYDYFLDHLSTEHYEDVQGEVIEIDAATDVSDIETLDDIDSFDEQFDEQDSVHDQNVVDDDYEYDEILQNVEIDFKSKFGQIEEVFLEESDSNSINKSEDIVDEPEEHDFEKIKDVEEIEAQILRSPISDETSHTTKSNIPPPRSDGKSLRCKECGKVFETDQKFRRHYKTHTAKRRYKCNICGFAFKERSSLDAHARRHTGIKPIGCGYCSKRFYTKSEAKNHRRTHTGERPYVCTTCGLAFTSAGGLNVHSKKHNSKPNYTCNSCGKGFYRKIDFRDHLAEHTKENPFVCHICGTRFPRYKLMIRHAKLHKRNKIKF